jgi:shikimate kinase
MDSVVLIGPPGAGKSTIGKILAQKMQRDFIDTDHLIEETTGKKIADIFLIDGEVEFRRIERDVVLASIKKEGYVISLGGGSVLDSEVETALSKMAEVVFLDVSISNAAPRVGFNRERPLLLGNPRQQWISLMEKRRPIYERIATRRISTDNRKAHEVVEELLPELTR